ncbi:formylglycine-generating enzyme family protein [Undibacterium sp. TS12]|uniref:formylglycine-generating enzyme family protein n=1 Tax=Undibacterium sp. TS12 TaxID=2908202 RepID=UPI001F4CCD02|nr:formylglycine-generating enzyme family protein [Undibacterium sp. TS12]MCH8619517.1 formylglycine-generating enzyme family protein [Undibacterium sp. TS12]
MRPVPAGTIALRDDRTGRQWQVRLAAYEMAATPVTQSLYAALTGLSPSIHTDRQAPVESVSWLDAVRFCNLLSQTTGLAESYVIAADHSGAELVQGSKGYRLPTEAEWEFACRAGSNAARYGDLDDIAWYSGNAAGRPHPVGQKQPNVWGLYDMLGNVWEWCNDQYDPEVYGAYRLFRGGGWADHERGCLATNRRRSHPTFQIDDLGFRLARSL